MKAEGCGFELTKQNEKTITVGKITVDESVLDRCNAELEAAFKSYNEWAKDKTPEQIKEAQDRYSMIESMGK